MKPKSVYFRSNCPISATLDLIGDKWSLLIIRDMALRGKTSYKEFSEGNEKIATNILAERLARLEAMGVVTRQKHPQNGVKVIYKLTEKGIDLVPLLIEIMIWSEAYHAVDERTEEFVKLARTDRDGVVSNITARLKSGMA
jgi:DNA-binding HxlR family transcriptional regulator